MLKHNIMGINIQENINSIVEEMIANMLGEGGDIATVEDLFEFLKKDPKAQTFAYVYYTYPVKTRQYQPGFGRKKAEKTPEYHDPMYMKLLKSSIIPFRWKDTYREAMLRANPDYQFSYTGDYHKVSVFEQGAKGTLFPIVVDPSRKRTNTYGVLQEDGNVQPVEEADIAEYLGNEYEKPVKFRKLFVNRINSVSGGSKKWDNPAAQYPLFK